MNISSNGFELDDLQLLLAQKLTNLAETFNQKSIFSFLKSYPTKNGLYIYGGVGRGKTMLMNSFFEEIRVSKKMIHYQDFMQLVHKQLHQLQLMNSDKALMHLADELSKNLRVLCLDEFEIKDIVDAMIVGKLFEELIKRKIFFVITSNTKPDNLYLDGLQRQTFLGFIHILNNKLDIFHLGNNHDYRLDKQKNIEGDRILYPINQSTNNEINNIISKLTNNQTYNSSIKIFGRHISFKKTSGDILITNFEELFLRDISYLDYINICQKYKTIVLQDIKIIEPDNSDLIVRFINFIDNAYFYKVLLFATLEVAPALMYIEGKRIMEFQRTLSRLAEMNSNSYLKE